MRTLRYKGFALHRTCEGCTAGNGKRVAQSFAFQTLRLVPGEQRKAADLKNKSALPRSAGRVKNANPALKLVPREKRKSRRLKTEVCATRLDSGHEIQEGPL
jgi:hypothetical protein